MGSYGEDVLRQCLKTYWGHDSFRPYQLEVIDASLSGRDAFVLMATGSGKSICYQLPAVVQRRGPSGSVTVVVSPLVSLMEDQVLSLKNNGISACFVGGSADMRTEAKAMSGHFPLVFITPEKVTIWDHGLRAIERGPGLALFAVDESHCMVEWGHDFRPSYEELRCLRERFPKVPIMALTATATSSVQSKIVSQLGLRDPFVAKTSFNRWNLHYSIKSTTAQSLGRELSSRLEGLEGSAIIYVLTHKEADRLALEVGRIMGSKGGSKAYHGGMSAGARRTVHHAFIRDEIQVVVATLAFGMGIDKPDVRLVIHCGLPKSMEAYYQQTGRAGRDGLPARCVLLFSRGDASKQRSIMEMPNSGVRPSAKSLEIGNKLLAEMEKFATSPGCRRRSLLKYFGEDMGTAKCDGCDDCDRAAASTTGFDGGASNSAKEAELFNEPARLVLQAVHDSGGRFGSGVPISLLLGTKAAKTRVYNAEAKPSFGKGKGRGKNEAFWKALFHHLHEREGLIESVSFLSEGGRGGITFCLSDAGRKFLHDKEAKLPVTFMPSDELADAAKRLQATCASTDSQAAEQQQQSNRAARDGMSEEELKVYERLFALRSEIAKKQEIPPYNVLGAVVLKQLAKRRPVDLGVLETVDGMSHKKVVDYGADIIKVLTAACEEFRLKANVPAEASQEVAWLTARQEKKPLTPTQVMVHERYTTGGSSLDIEQLASTMPRAMSAGTFKEHLAACLEGGTAFAWNRSRLGIEPALEEKILEILDSFKKNGQDPLAAGFRLKPVFEELPPGTDPSVYRTIKLILARLRFESKGGRLPGSGGETLAPPFSPIAPSSGKKRALPSWGAGITVGGALTKRATPPKAAPSSTPVGLFKPSYVPTPSPKGVKEDRFAVAGECRRSEPWTAEVVLRKIQQAGSSGASFKAMLAANPGSEKALLETLNNLRDDFVIFTKPSNANEGEPRYFAL
ncbi:unnamed protein product [Ascophyllum nodosum]